MATLYVGTNTLYQSGSGNIVGATSINLTTFTDIYGNVLTMADFGALGYITLEPDTTNEEFATFTGVTANANSTYTLTGVKTALAKSPYTQTSALVRAHAGGTKVVVTDNVAFWDTFVNKNNNSTIAGLVTFTDGGTRPVMTADTDTATTTALITFGQLSRQAIAGAANASTTVKGLKQDATAAQINSGTATGSTGATLAVTPDQLVLSNLGLAAIGNNTDIAVGTSNKFVTQTGLQKSVEKYAEDAGSTDAYVITLTPVPTSYATGMMIIFRANTANTGTATLNVNGLGAKTIVTGVSTTLATGDVATSQLASVVYNGTNFVLQSPKTMQASNGTATISSSTTVTITTGFRPRHITIHSNAQAANVAATSHGGYDITTNTMWCTYTTFNSNGSVQSSGNNTIYVLNITDGTNPTATTALINNITDTGFDVVYTKGTAGPVYYWTAIA